jgi:hypothetical protein
MRALLLILALSDEATVFSFPMPLSKRVMEGQKAAFPVHHATD